MKVVRVDWVGCVCGNWSSTDTVIYSVFLRYRVMSQPKMGGKDSIKIITQPSSKVVFLFRISSCLVSANYQTNSQN